MSDKIQAIGDALFQQGQITRDRWWASWVAGVENVMDQLRAGEAMAGDFQHLMPPPPAPLDTGPPPLQAHGAPKSHRGSNPIWDEMFGPRQGAE